MVASDGTLGGFSHKWGEDQPEVQRKRRLLEAEGIEFDDVEGKSSKIKTEFLVESASKPSPAKASAKKQNTEASLASTKTRSKYFNTISEDELKQEILNLLQKRQPGKTC